MQLANTIKTYMSSKGYDTWFSNNGDDLYMSNQKYSYDFLFENEKLVKIEITDLNIRDMKCTKIPSYVRLADEKIQDAIQIILYLREIFEEYLVNEFGDYTQIEENIIKTFLLNYMSNEIYETVFSFDIERYEHE